MGAVGRLQSYLEARPEIFLRQLQGSMAYARGQHSGHLVLAPLYPLVAAPRVWSPLGDPHSVLLESSEGSVYLTTDGMDPVTRASSGKGAGIDTAHGKLRSEGFGSVGEGLAWRCLEFACDRDIALDWMVDEFKTENGIDLKSDPMALQRLKEEGEKAKIALSSTTPTRTTSWLPSLSEDEASTLR